MDYESGFPLRKVEVGVDVFLAETEPIYVEKDEQIMQRLARFTSTDPDDRSTLSPTALYRYVACPLRFYFHSVARLRTDDEINEELDAPMFGTILHAAVQELYGEVEGVRNPAEKLRQLMRSDRVQQAVDQAIIKHYLCDEKATVADFSCSDASHGITVLSFERLTNVYALH